MTLLIDFEGTDTENSCSSTHKTTNATEAPNRQLLRTKVIGRYKPVKSPLPGSVIKVAVKVGQQIKRVILLLTLESMKMGKQHFS